MIGDLRGPLNEGEPNTVRLVMNVHEARQLHRELSNIMFPDRSTAELVRVLEAAIRREDEQT